MRNFPGQNVRGKKIKRMKISHYNFESFCGIKSTSNRKILKLEELFSLGCSPGFMWDSVNFLVSIWCMGNSITLERNLSEWTLNREEIQFH